MVMVGEAKGRVHGSLCPHKVRLRESWSQEGRSDGHTPSVPTKECLTSEYSWGDGYRLREDELCVSVMVVVAVGQLLLVVTSGGSGTSVAHGVRIGQGAALGGVCLSRGGEDRGCDGVRPHRWGPDTYGKQKRKGNDKINTLQQV